MKEKTELRIYYPKDNDKKMDMFLFNNQENKEQFVLTRNYCKIISCLKSMTIKIINAKNEFILIFLFI